MTRGISHFFIIPTTTMVFIQQHSRIIFRVWVPRVFRVHRFRYSSHFQRISRVPIRMTAFRAADISVYSFWYFENLLGCGIANVIPFSFFVKGGCFFRSVSHDKPIFPVVFGCHPGQMHRYPPDLWSFI